MSAWQRFVLDHGRGAIAEDVAAVVGQPVVQVRRVRAQAATGGRRRRALPFAELFARWHARPPRDDEWPTPRRTGALGTYEWQGPELALLASLVGRIGTDEIASTLSARLKEITGDRSAERTKAAVLIRMQAIGMQSTDVVGGLTISEAGREIGGAATIRHALRQRELRAVRVGRLWVIPHAAWQEWKARRGSVPPGFVPLRSIRDALGYRGDKLSEMAKLGFVPTAMRVDPYGTGTPSTQHGIWYIEAHSSPPGAPQSRVKQGRGNLDARGESRSRPHWCASTRIED